MLLNTKFDISVTNDGEKNNVSVNASLDYKVQDVIVSFELARKAYVEFVSSYISTKYGNVTKKQAEKIYANTTLKDMYEHSQKFFTK